jgi:hypothetical protein
VSLFSFDSVCSEVEPHIVSPLGLAQEVFSEKKHALTVGVAQ